MIRYQTRCHRRHRQHAADPPANAPPKRPAAKFWARRNSSIPASRSRTAPRSSSSRTPSREGTLRPGGTIVEGTAGNTGIGLAMVANALGFKTVIVIPDTQSQEKKDALRLLGAELIEVPAVPYQRPQQLCAAVGPAGRAIGARRKRTARSGPTSSTMSPTARPISKAPARRSGSRPTARSTASPARWAPAARLARRRHRA